MSEYNSYMDNYDWERDVRSLINHSFVISGHEEGSELKFTWETKKSIYVNGTKIRCKILRGNVGVPLLIPTTEDKDESDDTALWKFMGKPKVFDQPSKTAEERMNIIRKYLPAEKALNQEMDRQYRGIIRARDIGRNYAANKCLSKSCSMVVVGKKSFLGQLCNDYNSKKDDSIRRVIDKANRLIFMPMSVYQSRTEFIQRYLEDQLGSFPNNINSCTNLDLDTGARYHTIYSTALAFKSREHLSNSRDSMEHYELGRHKTIEEVCHETHQDMPEWMLKRDDEEDAYGVLVTAVFYRDMTVFSIPGGTRQSGESPWECAVRELKEETTIDLKMQHYTVECCLDHMNGGPTVVDYTDLASCYVIVMRREPEIEEMTAIFASTKMV